MPRHTLCILLLLAGCGSARESASIRVVDFIKEFDRAEQRPAAGYAVIGGSQVDRNQPAITGPAPGRVIFTLPLPHRGVFHATVAVDGDAPVRFRVGVSDDRIYEDLASVTLAPRGAPADLRADLSAYAGWKWSVFYRPDRVRWRLVLSADAPGGTAGRAIWASPGITTDTSAAREYAARRVAMP
jgi:hypothetical protein